MLLRSRTERVALYVCLPLLVVISVATWRLWMRAQELGRSLVESREQGLLLTNRLRNAQGREDLAGEALAESLRERDSALAAAEASRAQALEARLEADLQRGAADRLRTRRYRELDRMREALGRIAETDRTAMGMVVRLTQDSLLFGFDSAELRPEDREIVSRIAGVMLASYGFRAYVYGHTDDQGPAEYNQRLSDRRARAVHGYLVRAGVPNEILEVRGYGERSPRLQGMSREARRKNRRVEIAIIDTVVNYQGQIPASRSGPGEP